MGEESPHDPCCLSDRTADAPCRGNIEPVEERGLLATLESLYALKGSVVVTVVVSSGA